MSRRVLRILAIATILVTPALVVEATNANAAARSFFSPSLLGDPIAFCTSQNDQCGKAVADNWCTNNGFDKAILFQRQPNTASASHFIRYPDNGKVCTDDNCLSFAQIKCYSGS